MTLLQALSTTRDAIKARIIRALRCAAGEHEPWVAKSDWNGGDMRPVYGRIETQAHRTLHVAVCQHCRVVYCRRRDE